MGCYIADDIWSYIFLTKKYLFSFNKFVPRYPIDINTDTDNGLEWNKQHAIAWTHEDPAH